MKGFPFKLVVLNIHVHFQHDSRHTFLLTDSAFRKLVNTIDVITLPVAINPIFAAPSLGSVWTVWVSTGIPEKIFVKQNDEFSFIEVYSLEI